MKRAYSILNVKSFDEAKRQIEGMATTPTPDRMGDVIEPLGAEFQNPSPLLWQHNHDEPVGQVTFGKPTKDGIPFKATIAQLDEPGTLKNRLDEAWQSVKLKLVRAVSIGFRSIEHAFMNDGGIKFNKIEIMELSLVTIPANQEATITAIKSIDDKLRAASGPAQHAERPVALTKPGASGHPATTKGSAMTLKEQIAALEAKRAANTARMAEIMQKTADAGRTTDEAEAEEVDTLKAETEKLDADLTRLRDLEVLNVAKAAPVAPAAGTDPIAAARARTPHVTIERNLPKGTAFTRYAMALAASGGNVMAAAERAKRWKDSTPEVEAVLRSAVDAGTTTDADWASKLVAYTTMGSEFVELLRPATIVGRLPALRRVPFNVRMPAQTGGGTYGWVGEGAAKPVGKLTFGEITLRWAKAAGIIVISEELARMSTPSAEAIVQADMVAGIAAFLDAQFVTPSVAAVANVSPASITNGITPVQASGVTADNVRQDVGDMFEAMLAANVVPTTGAWIMNNVTAMRLSLMLNPLGQREFPDIIPTGGTFLSYPVIASESVPAGSDGALIIFVNQSDIFLSEEGLVIDVSREASLQFDTTPDNPATSSTTFRSLWQENLIGLRAERFINWKRRRDASVGIIESVQYGTGS